MNNLKANHYIKVKIKSLHFMEYLFQCLSNLSFPQQWVQFFFSDMSQKIQSSNSWNIILSECESDKDSKIALRLDRQDNHRSQNIHGKVWVQIFSANIFFSQSSYIYKGHLNPLFLW